MLIPSLCFAGGARGFDETNDQISNSSVPSLGTTNAVLTCWVKLDSTSESGAFMKVGTTLNGYGVGVGATTFDDAGNNLIGLYEAVAWKDTNTNIGTGWHHIFMRIDGGDDCTMNIDGVQAAFFSGLSGIAPTSGTITVGGYTGAGLENRFVDADMAYCAIYDDQLVTVDTWPIYQIMWLPESLPYYTISNGIQLLWPLWGSDPEQDISGNGRTGTVTESSVLQDGPPVGFGMFLPL